MNVSKTFNNLFENDSGDIFVELLSLPYVVKEITTCAQFHSQEHMSLGFECFIKFYHTLMPKSQQDTDFVHDFRFLFVIAHKLLVDTFECN